MIFYRKKSYIIIDDLVQYGELDLPKMPEYIIEARNRKNPAINRDTVVTILNGTESKVSPSELNNRLATQLALNGFRRVVRLESEGGVHASQDNIGWWTETERYSEPEAV